MGYWGNITATIDWCEENYQVTYYLVEFWNSISSVVIALLALYLLVFSLKHGLEKRFLAWEIAFFTVGVGSTLFHGSLRYEWQMWDEVPMMWSVFAWIFSLINMYKPMGQSTTLIGVLVFLYGIFVSWTHQLGGFVVIFQAHFILLMAIGNAVAMYLNWKRPVPAVTQLLPKYFGCLAIAAIGWLTDKFLCDHINANLPINPQLHAVWHVFVGLHAYMGVLITIITRTEFLGMKPRVGTMLYWIPNIYFENQKKSN